MIHRRTSSTGIRLPSRRRAASVPPSTLQRSLCGPSLFGTGSERGLDLLFGQRELRVDAGLELGRHGPEPLLAAARDRLLEPTHVGEHPAERTKEPLLLIFGERV